MSPVVAVAVVGGPENTASVGMWTRWPLTHSTRPLPWLLSVPSKGMPLHAAAPFWSDWHLWWRTWRGFCSLFAALPNLSLLASVLTSSPSFDEPISLLGLDSASVTSGRDLCPRGPHQSFPPNKFIHRVGIIGLRCMVLPHQCLSALFS